ncbi:hypothetical protein GmRootA79_42110 [Acidovorax sp. A79]|jgi:hypothetical protein|uniref:hypothetical protein n=1 Tax=Acidovorax sp. A79 TaxID=3056107 RepID=UPI0034E8F773
MGHILGGKSVQAITCQVIDAVHRDGNDAGLFFIFLPTKESSMFNLMSSPRFLRAVVWFDASTGVLLGALHLLLTAPLAGWLGLAPGLLQASGVLLLGYAALATAIARSEPMPRGWLWVLIVGNFAWALASLALLLGSAAAPTLLGQAYLLVHVVSVALLAELQWMGVRRLPAWAAA